MAMTLSGRVLDAVKRKYSLGKFLSVAMMVLPTLSTPWMKHRLG